MIHGGFRCHIWHSYKFCWFQVFAFGGSTKSIQKRMTCFFKKGVASMTGLSCVRNDQIFALHFSPKIPQAKVLRYLLG